MCASRVSKEHITSLCAIGANIHEAQYAQGKKDFRASKKMPIGIFE